MSDIVFKKVIVFLFAIICTLSLFGCGGKKADKKAPAPLPAPSTAKDFTYLEKVPVTENLAVKVYLDGTASMAGYTNKNAPSVFKDIMKSIEPVFAARWKSNKVEFVRFGDNYVPFNEENFLNFEREDFYQDKDTRLDNVIKDTDNKNLSIIITDLFQTNQHYTSLCNALESKCFGQQADRSFAIIGIKSQFKGRIYDIANDHPPIEYTSEEGNEATYRPLYLLVVGNDADVKVFAYEFQRQPKFKHAKVSLFTNEYGYYSKLALGKDFGKTKSGFQNKGDQDGIIHIKAKAGGKVNDKLAFTAKKLPVAIPTQYKVEITKLEKLTGGSSGFLAKIMNLFKKEKASFTQVDNKELVVGTAGINVDEANIDSEMNLAVDTKKGNEGKYKVTLGMFATRDDYVNSQDVFKGWNFDESRVPANDAEIGTKTQSISAFTQLVADKHYMQDKPGIKNIVFYLDVE